MVCRLTVILSSYNGEKYIDKQLSSILEQELPIHEILIIDDNSSDRTMEILDSFYNKYPDVFRITQNKQNRGAKKNFETALSMTTGDIVFFADQDDVWKIDKTKRIVAFLEKNPLLYGVFTNGFLIDSEGRPQRSSLWEAFGFKPGEWESLDEHTLAYYILQFGNIVTGATLAIRKQAMSLIYPFQFVEYMWHDEWIALKLGSEEKLGVLNELLIDYRVHNQQQVGFGEVLSRRIKKNDQVKSGALKRGNPVDFFSFKWFVYERAKSLNFLPEKILRKAKEEAMQAKFEMLQKETLFVKKLKLLKWYLTRRYCTSLYELIRF